MNFRTIIRTLFTPGCDHEHELHSLRNQLQASGTARELAERQAAKSAREVVDLKARLEQVVAELTAVSVDVAANHPPHLEYVDTLSSIQLQRHLAFKSIESIAAERDRRLATIEDLAREIEGLQRTRELLSEEMERSRELRQQIEELALRLAIAEATARDAVDDEQLDLMHSPIVEAGGEAPIEGDVLVSDIVCEQAYRLIGIWFEGRKHWVMARGDERIKAPLYDASFLARMERHDVSFIPGDTLRAEFRIQTLRRPNGEVYATHSVERVIQIIHPDEQLPLIEGREVANAAV